MTHKSTISIVRHQTLSRCYRVPSLLHSFYPTVSDRCWRFNGAQRWSCPRIQSFWVAVLELIYRITGIKIDNDPSALLLFMIPLPAYALRNSLIYFLPIAAKTVTPTITNCFKEIFYLQRMEEIRAESNETSTRNTGIWGHWVTFCSSPVFQTLT